MNEKHCLRCGHNWLSRLTHTEPIECPHCKKVTWNQTLNETYHRKIIEYHETQIQKLRQNKKEG